jgi:transcriptional regulator with XRE-family HTH domain
MLREAAGLSVAELARRIGVRQPSLWQLEEGVSKAPRASTLLRLAEALNASPEWLANGRGAPYRIKVEAPHEAELVAIFRSLPLASQQALVAAAKAMLEASPTPTTGSPFIRTK